ncbi:MAG: CPBP family intramembrane glutamic endopeptidase [Ilumatobacteraceae bacterium]
MSMMGGAFPRAGAPVPIGQAVAVWAIAWSLGGIVGGQIVLAASGTAAGDDLGTVTLAALAAVSWTAFIVAIALVSRMSAISVGAVVGAGMRPIDLIGVPIGVAAQFVIVPVLYVGLRRIAPDAFAGDDVERNARELLDAADGWRVVLLVVVVVVGAPIVEELVYRGLIQRAAVARFGFVAGVAGSSVFFGAIHLRPVELPGLIVAGAVFGVLAARTDRLGPAITAHMGFNAAGLVALAW